MVLAFRVEAFWHSLVRLQASLCSFRVRSSLKMMASCRWPAGQHRQVTSPSRSCAATSAFLMGAGGNIAVLPGPDGKLLIDAGFAGSRPKTEALASISSDPIKQLINTHWHFDHTDGNEWLHAAGAAILAHTNTKKRLSTTTRVEGWNFTFPPAPAEAIPADVFHEERTLKLNGTSIALKYYAPAHTDGDISVYFTDADVFHVGDTLWNGYYPFIDYSTGGSIDGMIRRHRGESSESQGGLPGKATIRPSDEKQVSTKPPPPQPGSPR